MIHPDTGTTQGEILSLVFATVYLHCVLDRWFEERVRIGNQGNCQQCRFADDFEACFEFRHEAAAWGRAWKKRMPRFGLGVTENNLKETFMISFGAIICK